jgi:hypothetical protein
LIINWVKKNIFQLKNDYFFAAKIGLFEIEKVKHRCDVPLFFIFSSKMPNILGGSLFGRFYEIRHSPVISAGLSIPKSCKIVGATSAKRPFLTVLPLARLET